MTLVVFDIDGTLTRTYDLDAALYACAFAETFGHPLPSLEWTTYRHVTDRGIAEEALVRLGQQVFAGCAGTPVSTLRREPRPGAATRSRTAGRRSEPR